MTDQLHVYYTLEHGKPYLGGFFNAFPPEQYRRIAPILADFPSQRTLETLQDVGVEFIVLNPPEAAGLLSQLETSTWEIQSLHQTADGIVVIRLEVD
jgi:hypothetical protein